MTTRTTLAVMVVVAALCAGEKSIAEQQPMPRTVAHAPGMPEALTYDAGATAPNSVRLLTSGSETKDAWSLVELTETPGTRTTWHRHTFDQAYYVREGVFTVKAEDKSYVLPAGGYIFIPRGTPHGTANIGTVVVRVLLTNAPAGFERYFEARAALLKQLSPGHPDFQKRMSELRKQHGTEELGTWDPREK
jgi:quercetin dioxygenase-like cupin family protein